MQDDVAEAVPARGMRHAEQARTHGVDAPRRHGFRRRRPGVQADGGDAVVAADGAGAVGDIDTAGAPQTARFCPVTEGGGGDARVPVGGVVMFGGERDGAQVVGERALPVAPVFAGQRVHVVVVAVLRGVADEFAEIALRGGEVAAFHGGVGAGVEGVVGAGWGHHGSVSAGR